MEMSVSNDYSTTAFGMDAANFGPGVIQQLPADIAAELNGVEDFSYYNGPYDLVVTI